MGLTTVLLDMDWYIYAEWPNDVMKSIICFLNPMTTEFS